MIILNNLIIMLIRSQWDLLFIFMYVMRISYQENTYIGICVHGLLWELLTVFLSTKYCF